MSDYSYERAILLRLISRLSLVEKEEFKSEIQDQLGLAPGQECDAICSKMSEQEFREFIEYVKEALLRKKRRMMKELAPAVYA